MSMKPCRECGQEVSSQAPICPKCGIEKPIKAKFTIGKAILMVLLLFIAMGVIAAGLDKQPDRPSSTSQESVATNQPQWAFDNVRMEQTFKAIPMKADWLTINMSPPSSFALIYTDRPGEAQVETDTLDIAKQVLAEISRQGKYPATDGILVSVTACESTCGATVEDLQQHGLGSAVYNPATAQLTFKKQEPPFPQFDVASYCNRFAAPPDNLAKNECTREEQFHYDYIKSVWSEVSAETKDKCMQTTRGNGEYTIWAACLQSYLQMDRLRNQAPFHY